MKKKTLKFVSMLLVMLTLMSCMMHIPAPKAYAAVVDYSNRVPLKTYTISKGNVTTYKSIGGEKSGCIYGSTDLCTIKEFHDGWVLVNYPVYKGTKNAYCPVGEFIPNTNYDWWETTAGSNIIAYRRSTGSDNIGEVFSGDRVIVVSEENERIQVVYPITGGYKLGWIGSSSVAHPAAPAPTAPPNVIGGVSYAEKTPLKTYALYNGRLTTYSSVNGSSTGYINGSDLCTVTEIYTNGWVKVNYPLDGGGTKTAYAKLADFVANPNSGISELTAPSNITAYRRSSGSDTIGTVYKKDKMIIVSNENGRYQAIYPVSGGYKMGWVNISSTTTAAPTTTTAAPTTTTAAPVVTAAPSNVIGGVSYAGKTPLKTYALYNGKLTTYSSVNGPSTGYIGKNDLCTITEIYTNGWVKVRYPLDGGGTKTAYAKLADFVANPNSSVAEQTASSNITAYRRSSGSDTIGTVYSKDKMIIVSKENGKHQVIYPVSGGYKMGWVKLTETTKPTNPPVAQPPASGHNNAHVSKNTTVLGGPGSGYASIGTVYSTDNIDALRYCGSYYEIEYIGQSKLKRGYVPASALIDAPDKSQLSSGEPMGDVFYVNKAVKTWGGPSSNNYENIGSVSYNEKVTCMWYDIDDDDTYACIEYNTANGKKRGYISGQYLSEEPLSTNISVNIVDESSNAQVRAAMMSILYGNAGGHMSCDFDGYTTTPGRHEGIDFAYSDGCPVYSLVSGTVTYTNNGKKGATKNGGAVSTVSIYDSENDKTVIYLHTGNIQVHEGQPVTVGQYIADESNYGTGGFHTHVEVRDGEVKRAAKSVDHYVLDNANPYPYWKKVMASYNTDNTSYESSADTACTYAISDEGLEFIKKWEGFRGYVYDDGAGFKTIGYGHKLKAGESFTTLTEAEALQLLKKDVSGPYTKNLNSFLKSNNIEVSQVQYDALLSFTYNCGENIWGGTFVLRTLLLEYKNGDKIPADKVRDAFGRWKYAGGKVMQGLVNRRAEEAKIFING